MQWGGWRRAVGACAVALWLVLGGALAAGASAAEPSWPAGWHGAASAPQPRFESGISVVNGRIYSFGGFNSEFQVYRSYVSYDATTNTWTSLGNMPAGMAETHAGIAHDDRYVYFAGGFGGDIQNASPSQWISDKVWRYDTQANNWAQIATLPQPRGAGALDLVGRTLHYFGGNPADRVTNLGDHWSYDLDTGGPWITRKPMPNPKDHFSTVVMSGKIYAFGGEHGHDQLGQQQDDMHVYDPASDSWTRLADLPLAKSHIEGGTFVSDGKIIMAGGQTFNFQPTDEVASYDPATNDWTTLSPSLPTPLQGAVVQRIGYKVVVAMGGMQTSEPQDAAYYGELPLPPAPTNVVPPAATGPVTQGVALTALAGTWNGATALQQRWQRCDDTRATLTCIELPGALGLVYTPGAADVGQRLRIVETASNDGGSNTVISALTARVAAAPAAPGAKAVGGAGAAGAGAGAGDGTGADGSASCGLPASVTLKWTAPQRRHLRRIVVTIGGKRYAKLPGYRRTVKLTLRRTASRATVAVRATDTGGRRLLASRVYRPCTTPPARALKLSPVVTKTKSKSTTKSKATRSATSR